MTLRRRLWVIAVCLLACGVCAPGQQSTGCSTAQADGAPCIDKIDPPGWWAGLPDPMLLVHGEGLDGARDSESDAVNPWTEGDGSEEEAGDATVGDGAAHDAGDAEERGDSDARCAGRSGSGHTAREKDADASEVDADCAN